MVISYTIKELNAIGEMVILKECISRMQPTSMSNFQLEFLQFQQQLQQQLGHQIEVNLDLQKPQEQHLTSSVAEFFKKAQQNFYAQTSIDPTKVRRLSEVEAELIGGRRDSC